MAPTEKKAAPKATEAKARMYPNNGLKQPKRAYKDTFSAVTVVKEMISPAKAVA